MKRSPMYAGVPVVIAVTLTLALVWLLSSNLPIAQAATFTVTSLNDSGTGSLRDALASANTTPGLDTITIGISGTIVLTGGELVITESVIIIGPGASSLAVDGNNAGRVISASADLSLSGLTIQNGNVTGSGGGIYASGALTLTNVNVISNTATNNGGGAYAGGAATLSGGLFQNNATTDGYGGGLQAANVTAITSTQFISNTSVSAAGGASFNDATTLKDVRFENNRCMTCTFGGGGMYARIPMTMTEVVFVGNVSEGPGGGMAFEGANNLNAANVLLARNIATGNGAGIYLNSTGSSVLLHATIVSPTVGAGAAIYVNTGTVDITNTIVASYTTGIQQAGGTVSSDYNLFYNAPTTVVTGSHSITGTNPLFRNPAGNDYHLTATSAAIDTGTNVSVTTDLDGNPRPIGNGYDIGAYELGYDLVIKKIASPEPAVAGMPLYYTITIANSGYPTTALGLVLSDTLPPSTTLGFTDQTDDDDSAMGFGGGITQNVQWNDPRTGFHGDEWLGLVNPNLYTGVYTSRVMDATNVGAWNNLRWTPWRPYGKELPNSRQAETAYAMGNANMLGNDVLLHLNESAGATTFTDTSGLGHNGACPASAGETCPAAGATGRFNGALYFNGAVSNTVVITDATNPARYAIELWVRPAVVTDTSFILRTGPTIGTAFLPGAYSHLLGISGDRFLHLVSDSNGTHTITSTTTVVAGTWYHVVGLAQSNGEINLYVNGVEQTRLGGLGTLWAGGDQYRLGSSYGPYGATTQYFTGDLDEVAVYSRTLSAAEITDHYLRGALHLSFQARSCADAACAGSGGFTSTLYSELNNTSQDLPSVTLTDIPNNRYFQYRATLTTDNSGYSPQLHDVRVGPDHYAVNAGQGSCNTPGASSFTCTLDSLASGGVITVVVPVNLDPSALNVITNTAWASGTLAGGGVVSGTAVATTTVIAQADVRLFKEDDWFGGTDPVNPGSPMTYTFRIRNYGPSTAWAVTLTDTLPISPSAISAPGSWACQAITYALTCTVPSLVPSTNWQYITVQGNAPTTEGMITNTAWITTATEISTTDNIFTETTWVTPLADLSIVKTAYPDPVNPGETLTYTLVVTNSGPYTATHVTVTDTLQVGLVGTAVYSNSLWSCSSVSNSVLCALTPDLAPMQSVSFEITVTAPMSGVLRNDAVVTSNTVDPDLSDPDTDNRVTTFAAVRPVADLALSKSDAPDPVNAGTPLTYTITVTNAGPVPAGALTTTLGFANSTYIGISGYDAGQAAPYPTNVVVGSVPGLVRNVTVTLNSLSHYYPGDLSILLVGPGGRNVVLMSNAGGGTDVDNVTLTFNDAGASMQANAALTSTVVYRPTNYGIGANLPLPAPLAPYGDSLSTFNGASPNGVWELYVYDNVDSDGGSIAGWDLQVTTMTTDTVTLTDTLPSGLTGVGVSPAPGWACNDAGSIVTCMGNTLPVNVPTVFSIAATAPITGSVITNTAEITSTTADLRLADNTTAITTTVLAVADLQISKTASPNPVGAGQALTYTLTFTNAGPGPVANVTITDALPVSVTLISAPGCTNVGNALTCVVASLPVNVPANLSFTVLAPPDAGVITNTAGITATVIDTNTLNNTAVATTTVTPIADLSIIKTDAPDPVWLGGIITYTLVVSNNGPSLAANVALTDGVPVSTTFKSVVPPAGWSCPTIPSVGGTGNVICTNLSLAAGTPATFTLAVQVDAGTPSGAVIANTATVSSDTADPTTPNTATAVTTVSLYKLYLPAVFRNYAVAPDLIVSSLVVTSSGVQVVIKNQGDAPIAQVITQEFWVDLYVDPTPPPTGVNQIWKDGRSAHGIVWGVTTDALPLAPGGTITLTFGGAYYRSDLSDMAWPLPVGTLIYAQVDSANSLTNYGAVLENHEIIGTTYNNITHTTFIASVMGETLQAPVTDARPSDFSDHLPPRP